MQRDASFLKMQQLAQQYHLKPAQQVHTSTGNIGVDVSNVSNVPEIDISKYLPPNWNGTKATQVQLMQLIVDIQQESIVFRDPNWEQKLAYYQQQLKSLMMGVSQ